MEGAMLLGGFAFALAFALVALWARQGGHRGLDALELELVVLQRHLHRAALGELAEQQFLGERTS